MEKKEKQRRMRVVGKKYPQTPISKFRQHWLSKGYELVGITGLCEFRLGGSGWCNDFNEPDEKIYHLQVRYRGEVIGTFSPDDKQTNWDEGYVVFVDVSDGDFIIFKKCKGEKQE